MSKVNKSFNLSKNCYLFIASFFIDIGVLPPRMHTITILGKPFFGD